MRISDVRVRRGERGIWQRRRHKTQYTYPVNPYHLGLEFGLERVRGFLQQQGEWATAASGIQACVDPTVHVIVEKRGKNEDDELELEFRRICDGANYRSEKLNFEIVFADKKSNSADLQLADLVALDGWGLKCFP